MVPCTQTYNEIGLQTGTLQDVCWKVVRAHITLNNVLDLLRFAEQLDVDPSFAAMHAHCMEYVARAYEVLRERKTPEELAAVLDTPTLARLEDAITERRRSIAGLRAGLGRVVDLTPPSPTCELQTPSVGGNPVSYPYSTLVAGVGWPADVDVSAREMYMCASEFQEVFGMNWDAYYALPMWKRRVLRQQHNLF